LRKNLTMKVLATKVGISEQTLCKLEGGSCSRVETLIRVVRENLWMAKKHKLLQCMGQVRLQGA